MAPVSPSRTADTPEGVSTRPTDTQKQRKRRKVSRTRAGCLTCKSRRKRCDMVRPRCGDCSRLNLECEWPAIKRIVKAVDETFLHEKPLPLRVGPVVEEQEPSPEATSSLGSPSSLDSLSTLTLPEDWPHARTDVPQNLYGGTLFPPQFNPVDDAILQLWAETCTPFLTDGIGQTFSSGRPTSAPNPPPTISDSAPNIGDRILSVPGCSYNTLPDGATQAQILQYFRDQLASLLSYDEVLFPNAFHAFNTIASANIGNPAGCALHCGILALASRHMFNNGQLCFERISERLGVEGSTLVMQTLEAIPVDEVIAEEESITLLAGLLMFIMYKICRGDVWGFESYFTKLKRLCARLFTLEQAPRGLNSTKFSFFENVVYHDTYGYSLYAQGPIIDPEVSMAYANTQRGIPHALTGLALPLYCIMPRIAKLAYQSRAYRNRVLADHELAEIVSKAEDLQENLEEERSWLENLIQNQPTMANHRYFHAAFRIACILHIKCFILCQPPDDLSVRLLVRNGLSLLETMEALNLPGFVSAHWIIFTLSICSALPNNGCNSSIGVSRDGSREASPDDRWRASKLYGTAIEKLAFLNLSRSRQIVQKLWEQNQGGRLSIQWLDILADFDWELVFA